MKLQTITYLGHSSILLHSNDKVIAVDPWITGNPSCPDRCKSLPRLDLILLTHGHSDHASEAAELAIKHGAELGATYELAVLMGKEGVPEEKLHFMNKGGTISWHGLKISLTDAKHSSSYDLPSGTVYAGEACGVVVSDGSNAIYHAGDTSLFRDMELIQESYSPTVALLPIGDRFTMGPKEAAKAATLLGKPKVIPIHFGTFPLLTGTAEEFSAECRAVGVQAVVLEPGGTLALPLK